MRRLHSFVAVLLIAATSLAQASDWVAAEVKKLDAKRERIVLKHGEIVHLDMPPMTMAFRPADPAWMRQVAEGDRLEVKLEKVNGVYTITELRRAAR